MSGQCATLHIAINALAGNSQWTGIGQYTTSLVDAISRTDSPHRFHLLSSSPRAPGSANTQVLLADPRSPAWEQLQLPTLLADHHIEVYHNPAFGLPIVKPCPCVCTVHDCIPRLFPDLVTPALREFFAQSALAWVRLADHLICVSEHTKHDFIHLYGADPKRCTVIYQRVPDYFRPLEDETLVTAVKAKYGIDKPYLLCVGRVELRKNIPRLVYAFQRLLAQEGPHWQLVLAGPKDADAQDPAHELPAVGKVGEVIVTGFVPDEDLVPLYNGALALCFPSLYEGFGRPVLEAMQSGTPVLTSRVSSLPEIGGEAALYVNPYDLDDLTEALMRVIADPGLRAELREKGLDQAQRLTQNDYGQQLVKVYEKVAEVN
jgi:glycosyltransferase involved in cell wall biosynthesis